MRVNSIFFKTVLFSPDLQMCLHGRGLWPLQTPVPLLPAGRRAKRVNDEAVKDLNLLFFVNFTWK